jgi:replicative DNA helicase
MRVRHDPSIPELAVLGAAMLDGAVVGELADVLEPHHFADPQRAEAWAAMVRLHDGGRYIDPVNVGAAIAEGRAKADPKRPAPRGLVMHEAELLAWLVEVSQHAMTSVNADQHAALIVGAARLRQIASLADGIAKDARETAPGDSLSFAEGAIDRLGRPFESAASAGPLAASLVAKGMLDDVRAQMRGEYVPAGPSTGNADLDAMIGTLEPRTLVLIGARSGHGKTAKAVSMAQAAARQGARTLYVSLEVSARQIAARMVAAEGRFPYSCIERRPWLNEHTQALGDGVARFGQYAKNIDIWDPPSATVPMIGRRVRRAAREGQPYRVVVLDYGQLLRPVGRHQSREQAVAEVADAVLELVRDCDLCALVPLQLNRENEKRGAESRPRMSDLRESSRWEHHAQVGLLLHRPALTDDTAPVNLCEVVVAKNRDGALGVVRTYYEPAQNRFALWQK